MRHVARTAFTELARIWQISSFPCDALIIFLPNVLCVSWVLKQVLELHMCVSFKLSASFPDSKLAAELRVIPIWTLCSSPCSPSHECVKKSIDAQVGAS